MNFNRISDPTSKKRDILNPLGHNLTIDEWIFQNIPCVLLYKDGYMDIYPIQEYTAYEQDNASKRPKLQILLGAYSLWQLSGNADLHV
jgi:hypothetical protein